MLTVKQRKSYLEEPSQCPYCKSSHIQGNDMDYTSGGIFQDVECLECGKEWTDEYKLVDVFTE